MALRNSSTMSVVDHNFGALRAAINTNEIGPGHGERNEFLALYECEIADELADEVAAIDAQYVAVDVV